MSQFVEYTLTLQSDGVIEAIANSIRSRPGQLDGRSIELAKKYANAVNRGVVDESGLLRELGEHLYNALFADPIGGHFYEQAWRRMKEDPLQGTFIRLRLVFQRKVSSEILSLPWEFLCFDGNFLSTDPKVAFSYRYDDWLTEHSENYLCEDLPLRVLFIHVHPEGYDVSFRTVRRNIQELDRTSVELDELENPSLETFREKLQRCRPHILHFLGHGQFKKHEGTLALSNKDGQVFWYEGQSFSSLFRVWQPRLMVLESCEGGRLSDLKSFSGNAAELVRQHIPAIVAMRYPFTQRSGWTFARTFYRSLANGNPIDVAVQAGRWSLAFIEGQSAAHASRDFAAPVLWMRVNHGRLFPAIEGQKADTSKDTDANSELKQVSRLISQLPENSSIQPVGTSHQDMQNEVTQNPNYSSGTESQPAQPGQVSPPKRTILFLASSPSPINEARLRLDVEMREIENGLRLAQQRDRFVIEQRWAVRPDDLRRALLDLNPEIVHFCGHGAGAKGLVLEDETGQAKLASNKALARLFKLFAKQVKCVVLNACYSEEQAEIVCEHIDYVVGMSDRIGNTAAIKFAVGFYDALVRERTYEDAFDFGCNAIELENLPEELTPVLKKKSI